MEEENRRILEFAEEQQEREEGRMEEKREREEAMAAVQNQVSEKFITTTLSLKSVEKRKRLMCHDEV